MSTARLASLCLLFVPALASAADPGLAASFAPAAIAPGATSVLRFDVFADTPQLDTAFTATLPAGVSFASSATTDCDGFVSVVGSTLAFTEGRVGAPCSVEVSVTAVMPGSHVLTSGALTSVGGSWGTATATLDVDGLLPGFSSSVTPPVLPLGETARLEFVLDGTAVPGGLAGASFGQPLPGTVRVAPVADAWTDCPNASIEAVPGDAWVSFLGDVPASAACTFRVDLVAQDAGRAELLSTPLTAGATVVGSASSEVEFRWTPVHLVVTDDPVPPGGTATLAVDVTNVVRDQTATGIGFSLDLGAAIPGLVATGLPGSAPCGPGSALSGSNVLTLASGTLASAERCHFEVGLAVPASASVGAHPLVTSVPTLTAGGPVVWPAGETLLHVSPVPRATLAALSDPVGAGESVTLEYTLANTSTSSTLTGLSFAQVLPFQTPPASLPPTGLCAGTGTALVIPELGEVPAMLSITGMTLLPGGSCTFQIAFDVPSGTPAGEYPTSTGPLSALLAGDPLAGPGGDAVIRVQSAPRLSVEPSQTRVDPGETVTLAFALEYGESGGPATGVGASLDLGAWIPGLAAVGPLPSAPCGAGSSLTGSSVLTLAQGSVGSASSCSFTVDVAVPASTSSGRYVSATSDVNALVAGVPFSADGVSVELLVGGIDTQLVFAPSVVAPGDAVTATWTLTNADTVLTAAGLSLTDDLAASFPGAVLTNVTPTACGTTVGSGGGQLVLSGGSLAPLETCTFSATFQLPLDTPEETATHDTGPVSATFGGVPVQTPGATGAFAVYADAGWSLGAGGGTHAGQVANLVFRIENRDVASDLTDIAFTVDLDGNVPGLVVDTLPVVACGPSSTLSGTSVLTFANGRLAPASSCTFSVDVRVPASVSAPSSLPLVTSDLTATLTGSEIIVGAVSADLMVLQPCRSGYLPSGVECVDIDECATGTDVCHDFADCTNTQGSHTCACRAGFTGDGLSCTDVDECLASPCDVNASCTNEPGAFVCDCDPGWTGSGTTCEVECGDGLVLPGEACDDGDLEPGDGCDASCAIETGWFCAFEPSLCGTVCGDGVIIAGLELCDDGNQDEQDGCDSLCQFESGWDCTDTAPTVCDSVCGDGLLRGTEECDDGGGASGDGCTADCVIEAGFACAGEPSVCELTCSNGRLDPLETCDDGGLVDGDGCDSVCQTESGWACFGEPSVCTESCGDGSLDPGEACDDGNLALDDGCSDTCVIEDGWDCDASGCDPVCGDGIAVGAEECDDGNTAPGDGCDPACRMEEGCTGEACETDDPDVRRRSGCRCDQGAAGGVSGVLGGMLALLWVRRRAA
ncbi:MAG: DUF4215 domain-containing protein [Myxococcota bacterium]